jgi:dCMP deaminase
MTINDVNTLRRLRPGYRKENNMQYKLVEFTWKVAEYSPDPSLKVGAIIKNKEDISVGCNRFPVGLPVTKDMLERPKKYEFIRHAEVDVIHNCRNNGKKTEGGTLYCNYHPCSKCANAIVEAGIVKVVYQKYTKDDLARWVTEWGLADAVFSASNIEVVEV